MKQKNDHAVVIRRVDYGEKDRIITVISADNGRISLLAKSVKAPKSRLAGGIELLSESEINFIEGRGDLRTLTGARLIRHWGSIMADRQRTQQAFDYLSLVNRISEDNQGQEYYRPLVTALEALNNKTIDNNIVEIWFYLNILKIFGSEPNLNVDELSQLKPGEPEHEQAFRFDLDAQQFLPDKKGSFGQGHIKLLRLCLQKAAPPKISSSLDNLGNLATLTRFLVKSHVG